MADPRDNLSGGEEEERRGRREEGGNPSEKKGRKAIKDLKAYLLQVLGTARGG